MKFLSNKPLLFIALSILFASCQNNSQSGPCDYSEEKFNMTVIDVLEDSEQENHFIVLVDFDGNIRFSAETQNLEDIRDVKTNLDFIVKNNIKTGNIYRGVVHQKLEGSGDCEEEIIDWDHNFKK